MLHIIDICLGALILIFVLTAAKKGFASSALLFVLTVLGTAVSWAAAAKLCGWVYQSFVRSYLLDALEKHVAPLLSKPGDAVQLVSDFLVSVAVKLGLLQNGAALPALFSADATVQSVEKTFFGPLATFLVKALLFALLAFVLGLVSRLLANRVRRSMKKSALHGVDTFFGGICGLLRGAVVVLIVCSVLNAVAGLATKTDLPQYVQASYFCSLTVDFLNLI